jgi:hypothetical protein
MSTPRKVRKEVARETLIAIASGSRRPFGRGRIDVNVSDYGDYVTTSDRESKCLEVTKVIVTFKNRDTYFRQIATHSQFKPYYQPMCARARARTHDPE